MNGQGQILPGTLDLLILKAVSLGPLHGYGVLLRISQICRAGAGHRARGALSRAVPACPAGTAEGKLGVSENNRRAKFYELTAVGRKRFGEETEGWKRLATAMSAALGARPEEV